jgi:hypothetical protein
MTNELLPLIAVGSVIFGVFLSIAKGYSNRPEGDSFKVGKLLSSLIIGVMGSLSVSMLVVNNLVSQINEVGIIALIVAFVIQGFGTDVALSTLDK